MPQTPSTRWCPTPEQLMILEEMYRTGVRTPNSTQIQQITAHLAFYGKIEGKNVFYWFQNHKARDRQKLRRRLSRQHQLLHGFNQTTQPLSPLQFQEPLPQSAAPCLHLGGGGGGYHHSPHLHFLHEGCSQDVSTAQGLNLLCKLEAGEGSSASTGTACSTSSDAFHGAPPCCRPLRTLELFPTTTTGLRDECSISKSSSCSTSTN